MPAGMERMSMKVRITGGVGMWTMNGQTTRVAVDDDGVNLSLSEEDGTALRGRRDGDVFRGELFHDSAHSADRPRRESRPASARSADLRGGSADPADRQCSAMLF
eukprot:gene10068-1177_t